MESHLPYIVGWSCLMEVGPVRYDQLISAFGSAKDAWLSLDSDFHRFGWGEETRRKILWQRRKIDPQKEFTKCQKLGVKLLTLDDPDYPKLLKEIHDPPFLLYVLGEILPEDELSLAVVGSRRMTRYGVQVIESLVPELCAAGLTIVSGLAFGVDFRATQEAFRLGGRSLSVLASGVDLITPHSNANLARQILSRGLGAVVSEFPLGVEAQPFYFPRRNRIISGLARGVLVVEAAEKSGSLITAKAALDQGRDVFAVPGSIFSLMSVGANHLLKQGAKLVLNAADILEEIDAVSLNRAIAARPNLPLDHLEESVLASLDSGLEIHVDEITRSLEKESGEVGSALTLLELKGMVKNIGGGYYRKS